MNESSIYVVDLETTGFAYNGNDRVLELALVELDSEMRPIASWSTLVNPRRDAGPKRIHGIESKWLSDAPIFSDIAKQLFCALDGAVLIAHNASFDINFLTTEAKRCGIDWEPEPEKVFDTMAIAKWVSGEGQSLKLKDLCDKFGILNPSEHSALGDAIATSELLAKLVKLDPNLTELFRSVIAENTTNAPGISALSDVGKSRPDSFSTGWQREFIPALVEALPILGNGAPESIEYLSSLHEAFQDFKMTPEEIQSLTELALKGGFSLEEISNTHESFFHELSNKAWADGILTDGEWAELQYVGKTLGITAIDLELARTGKGFESQKLDGILPLGLNPGDAVVLTGDMVPSKAEVAAMIQTAGLVVKNTISKKVRLCIAADADSMSGKASEARRLGITVLSVDMFIAQWR